MKEMQNNPHNRIMIAAPHSGSGKTPDYLWTFAGAFG